VTDFAARPRAMPSSQGLKVLPLELKVVVESVSEEVTGTEEDNFDIGLDGLKEQLGIDPIFDKLNSPAEAFVSRTEHSGSGAQVSKSVTEAADGAFDPTAPMVLPDDSSLKEEEFKLSSVFEETESFGPAVAEIIAQRINDACCKKAMETKLKELYEKYKTPDNCKYLCVPKVNSELWHDFSKEAKNKDLGLQEVKKGVVKAT